MLRWQASGWLMTSWQWTHPGRGLGLALALVRQAPPSSWLRRRQARAEASEIETHLLRPANLQVVGWHCSSAFVVVIIVVVAIVVIVVIVVIVAAVVAVVVVAVDVDGTLLLLHSTLLRLRWSL
jgi:hypothetical protein